MCCCSQGLYHQQQWMMLFLGKKGAFVVLVFTTNTSFIYPLFSLPQETLSSHHAVSQLEAICQPMGSLLPLRCSMSSTFVSFPQTDVISANIPIDTLSMHKWLCVTSVLLLYIVHKTNFPCTRKWNLFPKSISIFLQQRRSFSCACGWKPSDPCWDI